MISIERNTSAYGMTEYEYHSDHPSDMIFDALERCEECHFHISHMYVNVIERLKNEGYLPEGEKKLCCFCKFLISEIGFGVCPICGCKIRPYRYTRECVEWTCVGCDKVYLKNDGSEEENE